MTEKLEVQLAQSAAFLCWLADRVNSAATPDTRQKFVREFGRALDIHFHAVEAVVVPALLNAGLSPEQAKEVPARVGVQTSLGNRVLASRCDKGCCPAQVLALVNDHVAREYEVLRGLIGQLLEKDEADHAACAFHEHVEEARWHRSTFEQQDLCHLTSAVRSSVLAGSAGLGLG